MKLILEQADLSEPEIIIRGDLTDREVLSAVALFKGNGAVKKGSRLELNRDEESYFVEAKEILYFSASDDTVTAVTKEGEFRIKEKLYRLKETLEEAGFCQISKSVLLNTAFVRSIQAEFSGNYIVKLKETGEKLVISRRYFRDFKEKM